jgi:hypothetical protein
MDTDKIAHDMFSVQASLQQTASEQKKKQECGTNPCGQHGHGNKLGGPIFDSLMVAGHAQVNDPGDQANDCWHGGQKHNFLANSQRLAVPDQPQKAGDQNHRRHQQHKIFQRKRSDRVCLRRPGGAKFGFQYCPMFWFREEIKNVHAHHQHGQQCYARSLARICPCNQSDGCDMEKGQPGGVNRPACGFPWRTLNCGLLFGDCV